MHKIKDMFQVKRMINRILPRFFHIWRLKKATSRFNGLSNREIFNRIYSENIWGGKAGELHSGSGTYNSKVSEYIDVCVDLINKNDVRSVVDIGCGDFSISKQIVDRTRIQYTGVDVSDKVVELNIKNYGSPDVMFSVLDASIQAFPKADLITIRQVLQHLSNKEIISILQKAVASCKFLLITEHLPTGDKIIPNKDKNAGPDVRIYYGSGVFIEKPPFNLKVSEVLLEYHEGFKMFGTTRPAIIRSSLIKCN